MVRAYAFYWGNLSNRKGWAVVLAGNVAGARKVFYKRFAKDHDGTTNELEELQSTSPGPYWSQKAKTAKKPRVVAFEFYPDNN